MNKRIWRTIALNCLLLMIFIIFPGMFEFGIHKLGGYLAGIGSEETWIREAGQYMVMNSWNLPGTNHRSRFYRIGQILFIIMMILINIYDARKERQAKGNQIDRSKVFRQHNIITP